MAQKVHRRARKNVLLFVLKKADFKNIKNRSPRNGFFGSILRRIPAHAPRILRR